MIFLSLSSYWIFQKHGRIGTIIGNKQQLKYNGAQKAVAEFLKIFKDLTGNDFDPSNKSSFVKRLGKYQLLDIEHHGQKDVLNSLVPSKLNVSKYELMKLICDEKAMKDTMLSFDLDTTHMPLGKIQSELI